jgi:hypothetical protein
VVDDRADRSANQSESFYLRHALVPPGITRSGNLVDVVDEATFGRTSLAPYQTVFLCNVYGMDDQRVTSLRHWVDAGGGLVFFLGDALDREFYNEKLYANGLGLLPCRLEQIAGDPEQRRWQHVRLDRENHPVMQIFGGTDNPFLQRVKFFRWWRTSLPDQTLEPAVDTNEVGRVVCVARLNDPDDSPLLVERRYGGGRVVALTTSAGSTWSNWPLSTSYVVAGLELARHVRRAHTSGLVLPVGGALRFPVDPSRYALQVELSTPGASESVRRQAQPDENGNLFVDFGYARRSGLYALTYTPVGEGEPVTRQLAVSPPAAEGDLARMERDSWRRMLSEADVLLVDRLSTGGGNTDVTLEFSRITFALLFLALCGEQLFAWRIGVRR